MSTKVSREVFGFFKSRVGSWVGQDEKLADLHEWMSLDLEFLNVVEFPHLIDLDKWSDEFLEDWDLLNAWWDGVEWIDDYDDEDPNDKPSRLFRDKKAVIHHIVQLTASSDDGNNLVGYVELTNGDDCLFLIYTNFDSWVLSSGNAVQVVESLDQLTEKTGFYEY